LQIWRKCPHLHQETALQKTLLNILRIPLLAFIQTADPVVIESVVIINAISNFSPYTEKINVMVSFLKVSDNRKHLHRVIPVVFDWTEKPASEIILKPPIFSRTWTEGGFDRILRPVVQEVRNFRHDPGDVVTAGTVRPTKHLGGLCMKDVNGKPEIRLTCP
jgi:hypothetical protein